MKTIRPVLAIVFSMLCSCAHRPADTLRPVVAAADKARVLNTKARLASDEIGRHSEAIDRALARVKDAEAVAIIAEENKGIAEQNTALKAIIHAQDNALTEVNRKAAENEDARNIAQAKEKQAFIARDKIAAKLRHALELFALAAAFVAWRGLSFVVNPLYRVLAALAIGGAVYGVLYAAF